MKELLRTLCNIDGTSGREDRVREFIISRLNGAPYTVDALGSLIVEVKGRKPAKNRVMLCAHMDEVGVIATYIRSDGLVKFTTVGGIVTTSLAGKAVRFENGVLGVYVHNGKRAVLVEVLTSAPANDAVADFASTIARQIMATDPLALNEAGIDPAVLDRERNVYRQKAIEEGKPEKIIDKIVEGAVKKFCKEVCLLDQPYFFDEKLSVTDYMKATEKAAGMSIQIKNFISMKLGV